MMDSNRAQERKRRTLPRVLSTCALPGPIPTELGSIPDRCTGDPMQPGRTDGKATATLVLRRTGGFTPVTNHERPEEDLAFAPGARLHSHATARSGAKGARGLWSGSS
jgi:hypothetical protein